MMLRGIQCRGLFQGGIHPSGAHARASILQGFCTLSGRAAAAISEDVLAGLLLPTAAAAPLSITQPSVADIALIGTRSLNYEASIVGVGQRCRHCIEQAFWLDPVHLHAKCRHPQKIPLKEAGSAVAELHEEAAGLSPLPCESATVSCSPSLDVLQPAVTNSAYASPRWHQALAAAGMPSNIPLDVPPTLMIRHLDDAHAGHSVVGLELRGEASPSSSCRRNNGGEDAAIDSWQGCCEPALLRSRQETPHSRH